MPDKFGRARLGGEATFLLRSMFWAILVLACYVCSHEVRGIQASKKQT